MVARLLQFALFLLLLHLLISLQTTRPCLAAANQLELLKGFSATPLSSVSSFQPILNDPSHNFSLGFLRLNQNQLALAVLHVPSSEPLWLANPTHLATWSHTTQFFYNGSLVISDPQSNLVWSTHTDGDRALLLNTSNLQVHKGGDSIWQSFDFPTNTLVQDQNFTAHMALVSSNGLYSLRLGDDFMGLYAKYGSGAGSDSEQLYWKHSALEAKAEIVQGKGPIYARVNSDGYLAMYQTGTKPVDVQKFNTFQRPISSFLLVRVEPDGNFKGYYWDGSNWVLNYQAIEEICELPNPCGSYSLCTAGVSGCSCLDNGTRYSSEGEGGCLEEGYGDLCEEGIAAIDKYRVVRRAGVEAAHKELMKYETTSSVEGCEEMCEKNCKCWGALYSNASGYCYMVEHPIQTMLGTGDESKVGYFKVRKSGGGGGRNRVGAGVVGGTVGGMVGIGGIIGVACCVMRRRRRRGRKGVAMMEEDGGGASPGPYKNLSSASFRCIEMSNSNSK